MKHPQHELVLAVLEALDAPLLAGHRCLFGGGTRLALDLAEYRVSADVDFLVSDAEGYAALRARVRTGGASTLFRGHAGLTFPREPTTDQYGVRFPVQVGDGGLVKLEIVREGRITLSGSVRPAWSPVACLTEADAEAEKLMANSDRWLDAAALSRDLLDLAALRQARGPIAPEAWQKATSAYGASVTHDLAAAAEAFLGEERGAHRERCFTGLQVQDRLPLLDGVRAIAADVAGGVQ